MSPNQDQKESKGAQNKQKQSKGKVQKDEKDKKSDSIWEKQVNNIIKEFEDVKEFKDKIKFRDLIFYMVHNSLMKELEGVTINSSRITTPSKQFFNFII